MRLAFCLMPLALALGCASAQRPTIVIESGAILVKGVQQHHNDLLRVWVADAGPDAPPLLGEVSRRDGAVVFTPKYPLRAGLAYRARYEGAGGPIESVVKLPAPPMTPVVRVAAVYPSADELPENLLKFYIQFSGPMSRGEAYQRIRLLDQDGQLVPRPFLELGEELWNHETTRFTLFFEPGRIKTGLVPRQEMGLALSRGKTYTLEIDAAWQDDRGRPLVQTHRKTFRVTDPDTRQPDPARWKIQPPRAGSTDPLVVIFDEPLDHGMLQRVITVSGMAGKVEISQAEKRWSFTPAAAWKSGRHVLAIETILEDTAGNSIGRPFEVDANNASVKVETRDVVERPFEVR